MFKRIFKSTIILLCRNRFRTILLCIGLLTTAFAFALGDVSTSNVALSSSVAYASFPSNAMLIRGIFNKSDYELIYQFDSNLKYCFASIRTYPDGIIYDDSFLDVKLCSTDSHFCEYPTISCDTDDSLEITSLLYGRTFKEEDKYSSTKPAIIHISTALFLFGTDNPIGKNIKFENGTVYTVIGILKDTPDIQRVLSVQEKKTIMIFTASITDNFDYAICVAENNIGNNYSDSFCSFLSQHSSSYFQATTLESISNDLNQIAKDAKKGLTVLSSVMYVVCTIFIFSIMLFFVKERVTEIGIRRAIGAESKDISMQFLLEMSVLALISGIIGTILGLCTGSILSYIITTINGLTYVKISFSAIVLPTMLSLIMALIASVIPSMIASKITIKECLQFD